MFSVDVWRSHVTEDYRVIVLAGLVTADIRIAAGCWSELVFSDVGGIGCIPEVEPVDGKDIDACDVAVTIYISGH